MSGLVLTLAITALFAVLAVAACVLLAYEVRDANRRLRDSERRRKKLRANNDTAARDRDDALATVADLSRQLAAYGQPLFPFPGMRLHFTNAEVDARCADLEHLFDEAGDDPR